MKKLVLIAMAASLVTGAFAQKHMVRFAGWDDGQTSNTFDLSTSSTENVSGVDNDASVSSIALNYAYAFTDAFQLGGIFKNNNDASGLDRQEMGISGYWNLDGSLLNTNVLGVHLTAGTQELTSGDDDNFGVFGLEFGHRFEVGSAWGLNLTYSPTLLYNVTSTEFDNSALDDETSTEFTWNWLKFDVLF